MKKEDLIKEAQKALELSYSPYSKFQVGAAILTTDGKIFKGANVENASYPLSMCAERNAIYNAMMNGYSKKDFVSLAVIGATDGPISPCGACRQVISEQLPGKAIVWMANLKGQVVSRTVDELLPGAFKPEDLSK